MLLLSRCSYMTTTHEFGEVDAEDIQEILDSAEDGAEMIEILKRTKFPLESGKTLEERKKYYENLIDKATALTKAKYSKEEREICVALLLSIRWLEEPEVFEYCKSVSDKYLGKTDSLSDETWWICERLHYNLLAEQARGSVWDFDEVKGIVAKLKENKERFEKLNLEYEW